MSRPSLGFSPSTDALPGRMSRSLRHDRAVGTEGEGRADCPSRGEEIGVPVDTEAGETGWLGIGVLACPVVVFAAARNLAPSLGKASYALGVLPSIGAAALLAYWLL